MDLSATAVDEIDDIVFMVQTMTRLGVSHKGLKTLDEMKSAVKQKLTILPKKSSWTAREAFVVLKEAKEEDKRKRATLHKFFKDTETCLHTKMNDKLGALLEQNIGHLDDKISSQKRSLKRKEYVVLVAGETSSGKSTLLNLILGEQLLPSSTLSTTSTICELKYGDTPKIVAHLKDRNHETKTVYLDKSAKIASQISSFVHLKESRERGSNYEKIELFWPHSLLKEGIVIVDSPGIGESAIMDDMVKEYLPEAFLFIYVINSSNAGGIQQDRLEKLIEHARQVSLEHYRETSSACALFVCNKWDQVPSEETDEVKDHIVRKLKRCWPNVDPESQIIYMSSTTAREAQTLGIISEEFVALMNGIKSMVLKSVKERLFVQWRWLYHLLSRMVFHTKAFINNSSKDRQEVFDRMIFINERLRGIEEKENSVGRELQEYLENQTESAVTSLSKYLTSSDVVQKFTSWTLDDTPRAMGKWEVTKIYIQEALTKRLQEFIAEWEEREQVFSGARGSLIQYFQQRYSYVVEQLENLESFVIAEDVPALANDCLPSEKFSVVNKVVIGVTSPIWVPIGVVAFVLSVPVVGVVAMKEKLGNWNKIRKYENDKCGFMAKASLEYLLEAAKKQNLKSLVVEQLKEARVCLEQVVNRIPELIKADRILCQKLTNDSSSQKELDIYRPIHERSLQLRRKMAVFGIQEVSIMDISCDDLELRADKISPLGRDAFTTVHRGTLKMRRKDESVEVAVKVWNSELENFDASDFLSERETLRKLNHPFIVNFYGAALIREEERLRVTLVMELCKENLMGRIFQNRDNIPSLSLTPGAARSVIRWARDIANALDFIHSQGIVHRDFKLENIMLSHEDDVRVANVSVSRGVKMTTGTMKETFYIAPEVIKSGFYDSKADIYSFGIMLWEMWYGKRALTDVEGDVRAVYGEDAERNRPTQVDQDRKKPPSTLQDLMQGCLDEEADKRPDATACRQRLTMLYQDTFPPI